MPEQLKTPAKDYMQPVNNLILTLLCDIKRMKMQVLSMKGTADNATDFQCA